MILLASTSLCLADVRITEFLASNDSGLEDENGDDEDWIEIQNSGPSDVDLDGWSLTDDPAELRKWVFPQVTLPAGESLVIFASGKNRAIPGFTLHTNFSLKKSGEYLALVENDGSTIANHFHPSYPPQATDVSYGDAQGSTIEEVIGLGTSGRAGIPTSLTNFNLQFNNWNSSLHGAFLGSSWKAVDLGIGYENLIDGIPFGDWISSSGDLEAELYNQNPSVFVRIPFSVSNASQITAATLRMRWDDGFVAYLNGTQMAADRDPASLTWDAVASAPRSDELNEEQVYFPVDLLTAPLNEGANLLAIHGLNRTVDSSDMLIQPELVLERSAQPGQLAYFTEPSPGATNLIGELDLAPLFELVTDEALTRPTGDAGSPDLVVTAVVLEGTHPISEVRVHHRAMFGPETTVILADDGVAPDLAAGDGTFTGSIPTTQVGPGEMLRWRFEATDTNGGSRTSPAFTDPLDSDRYYGTVAEDSDLADASLTVLQTFVEDAAAVDTASGDRVSLYYLGRFYDNIQMDVHGQSSLVFPKKSYDLDFNRGNRFTWDENEDKVKDINLLTTWGDKSRLRNTIAYSLYQQAGHAHHFAFPVRVERNGSFFAVADLVEDGDDRFLERIGLDPEGALYKMNDRMVDVNNAAKKTRKEEDHQDLQDFFDIVDWSLFPVDRRRSAYDHLDIAATINHLVANQVIGITDTGHKNYYLYRDTEGSGEWQPLPWDVDLSAGHRWDPVNEYFNDALLTGMTIYNSNPLWELIYITPEFQEMFVRRFETMRRELLQAPGTPAVQDVIRQEMIALEALMNPPGVAVSDSDLDYNTWGTWGPVRTNFQEAERIWTEWLPAHRTVVFDPSTTLNGVAVPPMQSISPNIVIHEIDVNPASGNQDDEYIILKNNDSSSFDLSGWTLDGAIDYTFPAGTVILQGNGDVGSDYQGLIHIARNSAAFRNRSSGPSGNEYRYVQGNYGGQLSARGETIFLRDPTGLLVDQLSYVGQPTDAQQYLRLTEINYHPADPTAGELASFPGVLDRDFEYLELVNLGPAPLDLTGARFTEGIDFEFTSGPVLGIGEHLVIAKNPVAFALRYGNPGVPVLGPFGGQLDNGGEQIQLVDAVGENILEFSYNDYWFPSTDGAGSTLVLRDLGTPFNQFDEPESWGSSLGSGSPGAISTGYQVHFNAWQAARYDAADRLPGMPGHPDSDVDNDKLTTWAEYVLATDPNQPNPIPAEPGFTGSGAEKRFGVRITRRRFMSDVDWTLLSSSSLNGFSPAASQVESDLQILSTERESLLIHDSDDLSSVNAKFHKLEFNQPPPN